MRPGMPGDRWRGLTQRMAEAALFGSLVLIGWRVATLRPAEARARART